jgi:Ulp1 family protease
LLESETQFKKLVNKQDFKKGWAKWEKLFFPIQHNDHWLLIVADKVDKEIKIYDLFAYANKHHFYVILTLVNKMKTKKENWTIDTQQTLEHQVFQ